jgi:Zn-dependent metalloprotease
MLVLMAIFILGIAQPAICEESTRPTIAATENYIWKDETRLHLAENPSSVRLPPDKEIKARELLESNGIKLDKSMKIHGIEERSNGETLVWVFQHYRGVTIEHSGMTYAFEHNLVRRERDGSVYRLGNPIDVDKLDIKLPPTISQNQAITKYVSHFNKFTRTTITKKPSTKLVVHNINAGTDLKPAYKLVWVLFYNHPGYMMYMDAHTGEVIQFWKKTGLKN